MHKHYDATLIAVTVVERPVVSYLVRWNWRVVWDMKLKASYTGPRLRKRFKRVVNGGGYRRRSHAQYVLSRYLAEGAYRKTYGRDWLEIAVGPTTTWGTDFLARMIRGCDYDSITVSIEPLRQEPNHKIPDSVVTEVCRRDDGGRGLDGVESRELGFKPLSAGNPDPKVRDRVVHWRGEGPDEVLFSGSTLCAPVKPAARDVVNGNGVGWSMDWNDVTCGVCIVQMKTIKWIEAEAVIASTEWFSSGQPGQHASHVADVDIN